MSMQKQINIRLPEELLDQVEDYREKVSKSTGLAVNRSDAVRVLLAAGLKVKAKEDAK